MALGGVAMGNMNANEAAKPAGSSRYNGFRPSSVAYTTHT